MQKVGRRGGKEEGGHVGVSWSAGAGQGLPAALQGCREGSGGDGRAPGEGHWAVWVWGCVFTGGLGILHALPLVPVKRIIPPPAGRQHPIRCAELPTGMGICGCTDTRGSARALQGGHTESLVAWGYRGYKVVVLGPCWWYPAGAGLAGAHAHSAPRSWHRRAEDRPLLSARRGVSPGRE